MPARKRGETKFITTNSLKHVMAYELQDNA